MTVEEFLPDDVQFTPDGRHPRWKNRLAKRDNSGI